MEKSEADCTTTSPFPVEIEESALRVMELKCSSPSFTLMATLLATRFIKFRSTQAPLTINPAASVIASGLVWVIMQWPSQAIEIS